MDSVISADRIFCVGQLLPRTARPSIEGVEGTRTKDGHNSGKCGSIVIVTEAVATLEARPQDRSKSCQNAPAPMLRSSQSLADQMLKVMSFRVTADSA